MECAKLNKIPKEVLFVLFLKVLFISFVLVR
jgi:hypothetical protein